MATGKSKKQGKLKIRPERPEDQASIYNVHLEGFDGQDDEARLVEKIRASSLFIPGLSLVAERDGEVIGHVLFSPIDIQTDDAQIPALALAPIAILPRYQDNGVGTSLVWAGLETCKRLGHSIVIVLGHSTYYPRFGFSAELAESLECPFGDCGVAWMALELKPHALEGVRGRVIYPPAFDTL